MDRPSSPAVGIKLRSVRVPSRASDLPANYKSNDEISHRGCFSYEALLPERNTQALNRTDASDSPVTIPLQHYGISQPLLLLERSSRGDALFLAQKQQKQRKTASSAQSLMEIACSTQRCHWGSSLFLLRFYNRFFVFFSFTFLQHFLGFRNPCFFFISLSCFVLICFQFL